MTTFLPIFLWFLIGIACSYFATKRGRDPYAWFAIGILFGIFGFIALFFFSPLKTTDKIKVKEAPLDIAKETSLEIDVTQAPTDDFASQQWFYINPASPQEGPVPFATMTNLWQTQAISEKTFVWHQGMAEWKRIQENPALIDKLRHFYP